MLDERAHSPRRLAGFAALGVILLAAATATLWNLGAGLPYAVAVDEPHVIDRALRILRTGEWNPHIFDYPTLVIYFQALVAIARFLWGALKGQWASLDGFSITAVYTAGRFAAAMIGVTAVWLTYRLGTELSSRRVGLLAAAQLAVQPIHVRESRLVLTNVPMAALTTLAIWLAVRAGRLGTVRAYAWAGMASGLAASAQYTGGMAIVPVVAAWAIHERSAPDRLRKLGAIVLSASLAFIAGSPFTILDLPGFLDGFAAQFARFAVPFQHAQPAWLLYVKELSQGAAFWVPLALAGLVVLVWRRSARSRWAPVVLFALTYFYLLASHGYVSGSEAVPLLPALCLFSSVAAMELLKLLNRIPALARPAPRKALLAAVWIAILVGPIGATVRTLALLKRTDTRELAADWLKGNAPRGARLAVEPNGPTYLDSAGFKVAGTDLRLDRAIDWYRPRVDYLVISAADVTGYGEYLRAGPTVFQIGPTSQRLGPPILIVEVDRP